MWLYACPVSSGSVTVNADSTMQVLAEEVCPFSALDMQAVRDAAQHAQTELTNARTERQRAEALVAIECLDAVQKALG